ncbi:hypothetical protein C8F04DRAFT_153149 [Mycena alexandri]|uniref:Uncharacterized protein n=1 Tax=Mycena alexandri TaxID=1745969 RepID=A0AAD6SC21_9AGAR|nr:hypothetical protein C8F04DRAFT_153149 [Mycena alexandri]
MVKGEGSERPKGPITSHAKTSTTLRPSLTRRLPPLPPLQARRPPPRQTHCAILFLGFILGACSRVVLPSCKAAILHPACVDSAKSLLALTSCQTTIASATRLPWEKKRNETPPSHGGQCFALIASTPTTTTLAVSSLDNAGAVLEESTRGTYRTLIVLLRVLTTSNSTPHTGRAAHTEV